MAFQPCLSLLARLVLARPRAMGSMGWARCFWCPRWVYNPYILDWIGEVLCERCYDNHLNDVNDGFPPHPNAIDHKANALDIILPPLRACGREVVHRVASFLESPWQPGAGSLPHPHPRRPHCAPRPTIDAPPPPTAPGGPPPAVG